MRIITATRSCIFIPVLSLLCSLAVCPCAPAQQPIAATKPQYTKTSTPDIREEAWRTLWSGVKSSGASRRVEAVNALALMKGNRRAMLFAFRALDDKDYRVRAAAAATLGSLHDKAAVPALKSALSDKEVSVMLAAAHALYLLKDPEAYEIYYAILMRDKKATSGLIQSQIDRLKDPKQVLQMGFEEGIGFVPYGGMGLEAYRTIVKRGDDTARASAARFLAFDPDPISEDALIQAALVDNSVMVREAALQALAEKGDPRCIQRLETNLHDNSSAVRYWTSAAIIRLSSEKERQGKAD
jgi:HEAT repeat protein